MGELRLREHRAPLHGYWILPGGGASQTTESSEGGLFNIAQTKGVGSEMILASYLRYKERQPYWGVLWHLPFLCCSQQYPALRWLRNRPSRFSTSVATSTSPNEPNQEREQTPRGGFTMVMRQGQDPQQGQDTAKQSGGQQQQQNDPKRPGQQGGGVAQPHKGEPGGGGQSGHDKGQK
jgi:hypothetical protein